MEDIAKILPNETGIDPQNGTMKCKEWENAVLEAKNIAHYNSLIATWSDLGLVSHCMRSSEYRDSSTYSNKYWVVSKPSHEFLYNAVREAQAYRRELASQGNSSQQ